MIGTVEEAKKWWCPMARVAFGWAERVQAYQGAEEAVAATANRGDGVSHHCNCIADKCAAWRWAVKDPATYDKPVGYCGAFGRPEAV